MKRILLLSFVALITACNNSAKDKEIIIKPHEYSEIEFLRITWDDLFNQKENYYLVYLYGDHCSHCHEIKNEIITYALEGKNKIYFCNDSTITFYRGDLKETLGKTDIAAIFINGTPSVIEIKNKTVFDNVCGTNKVLQKIRGE